MACDLCGDTGTIYDFNKKGDPCPQCTGGRFHTTSMIKIRASNTRAKASANWGCAVVLLAWLYVATVTIVTTIRPL